MRSPVLVSRTVERARLRAALDGISAGQGGLWVVRGDPGIGKSRLAAAVLAEAADRGLAVLSGRAVPSGTPTPLRPLGEALLAWLRRNDVPDDRSLAPYLPTMARLAPQLGPTAPDSPSSVMLLGEGLLRLAQAVPEPGMVLVVEDLHWADPETLAVLEYVADNARDVPLAVVATVRLHEAPEVQELVAALDARRSAEVVDLQPMPDDDVAAIADACLGAEPPAELVGWLQQYSAGYPLFVEEMLADLRDSGVLAEQGERWVLTAPIAVVVPRPFARSVEGRLAAAGATGRELAGAAALLGVDFDWRTVGDALGLEEQPSPTGCAS